MYFWSQAGDVVSAAIGYILDPIAFVNKTEPRMDEESVD